MSANLTSINLTYDPTMLNSIFLSSLRTIAIPALALLLGATMPIFSAHAQNIIEKGVLDKPIGMPTTGSGTQQTASSEELILDVEAIRQELKAERQRLKRMNHRELLQLAQSGERAAQLVLAENFADEANYESISIISGNDAMSDAAYWYALAARRGFPGSIKVDGALPLFPLRSIRSPG